MPREKPGTRKHSPAAKILEEFSPGRDPWKGLRNKPGIKILSTGRREPG